MPVQPPEPPRDGSPEQLVALTDQARAGQAASQAAVQDAMRLGVNVLSLSLLEVQVRVGVLGNALFGENTADSLMYEISCHQQFLAALEQMVTATTNAIEEQRKRQRMAALVDGIQVQVPPDAR